jgi:hypothetical protein
LPAWRLIDPLPVLSFFSKRSDQDESDDSIEAAVEKGGTRLEPQPIEPRKPLGGTRSIKWRMVADSAD